MLEVFDMELKRVAILENAFGVEEKKELNALWYLEFSLPEDDPKNEYCLTYHYVRHDGGQMYRIMPSVEYGADAGSNPYEYEHGLAASSDEIGYVTYECEHVLATLIDNIMFGYHVVGNIGVYTRDSVEYVLSKQKVKRWVLGDCEFSRQFEYGWENENLLAALFSVAAPFSEPYIWVPDTSRYPWVIHLRRLQDGVPECYIIAKKNLVSYERSSYPEEMCTRLYPLGYGEGVNQLGIKEVNGGVPYIQSPKEITDKYGIIERVWIDRRYENAESLLAASQKMLTELQEPVKQYSIGYQEIEEQYYDRLDIGKRVQIRYKNDVVNTVVTYMNVKYDAVPESMIKIANKSIDIASTVSDLADRQRIEMAYAQGATQLYAQSLQANCDSKSGAVMSFYIPSEMRIVNNVKVKIKGESFRAYSKATSTREDQNKTSSSGGRYTSTSSSGGGGSTTSADGGGTTRDTGDSGVDVEWIYVETEESQGHTHTYKRVNSHKHEVTIPDHSHRVSFGSHSHSVDIPAHTHTVTIPAHDHTITPGIYRFGSPKQLTIYVNGVERQVVDGTSIELDITDWLVRDGKIPRGTWHDIEVRPDDLAYIMIDMYVQGFVQSRGDTTV